MRRAMNFKYRERIVEGVQETNEAPNDGLAQKHDRDVQRKETRSSGMPW